MMDTRSYLLMAVLVTLPGYSCIEFSNSSLKDKVRLIVCHLSDLTFPWDVVTGDETINDVKWFFQNRLVAILTQTQFNVMKSYSGRVTLTENGTGNAGIVISHVTSADKGNYSIEIEAVREDDEFVTLHRNVSVHVQDGLMTTDGNLKAVQLDKPEYDNDTQDWYTALACGYFLYPEQPPFEVVWTIPSGKVMRNTRYSDGQFKLLLPHAQQGGIHSCVLPNASKPLACIRDPDHALFSSVLFNDVTSRLSLLERRLNDVRESCQERLTDLREGVDEKVQNLTENLYKYGVMKNQVAFHAVHARPYSPASETPLIMRTVKLNQGQGYDSTTGKFRAPYAGTYVFLATVYGFGRNKYISVDLMVDGKSQVFTESRFGASGDKDSVALSAVVRLQANQSVWVENFSDMIELGQDFQGNSFSGFLLYY